MGLVAVASGQLVVICLGGSRLRYIVIWPSDNRQRLTVRGVPGSELHGRKKKNLAFLPMWRARRPDIQAVRSSWQTEVCSAVLLKQEAKLFPVTGNQNPARWDTKNSGFANGLNVLCPPECSRDSFAQIHPCSLYTHKSYPLTPFLIS